jgi:hypothetical protein
MLLSDTAKLEKWSIPLLRICYTMFEYMKFLGCVPCQRMRIHPSIKQNATRYAKNLRMYVCTGFPDEKADEILYPTLLVEVRTTGFRFLQTMEQHFWRMLFRNYVNSSGVFPQERDKDIEIKGTSNYDDPWEMLMQGHSMM